MSSIIRGRIANAVATGFVALAPLFISTNAGAVAPNFPSASVTQINSQGFRICKSMGKTGYTAVARGLLGDGGGGRRSGSSRYFQLRTCFETQAQCHHFIDRIHHRVSQIDQLNYIGCSPRS